MDMEPYEVIEFITTSTIYVSINYSIWSSGLLLVTLSFSRILKPGCPTPLLD